MRAHTLCLAAALLVVGGCETGGSGGLFNDGGWVQVPSEPLKQDPSFPGTPSSTNLHPELFTYTPDANCKVINPMDLELETQLRIFQGAGVTDSDLKRFLGALQRYYAQYGIRMATRYEVIPLTTRYAMDLDERSVAEQLRQMGFDPNTDPDTLSTAEKARFVDAVGRAVMHTVREFMEVYGKPRRREINIILLREMVTGDLDDPDLKSFKGILGLGFSPELLQTIAGKDDPARQLYQWFGITNDFTPTAIVGVGPTDMFLSRPDIPMAHEIGHTYGLAHVEEDGNLLKQGDLSCKASLTTRQLGAVREAHQRLGYEVGAEALSLTSRAGEFVLALRRHALQRNAR